MKIHLLLAFLSLVFHLNAQQFDRDQIPTDNGILEIAFIGHGSLLLTYGDQIIHIDPSSREANYKELPKADLILITHHHGDHCDPQAYSEIVTDKTVTYLTALAYDKLGQGQVLKNGDEQSFGNITITTLPAYNLQHMRSPGEPYHPKGCCNSYLLQIDGLRVFIGGDTENTPEMKALKDIDVAFLPMNLPYTMTPEMVADAAKAFRPAILYPYHYGSTDTNRLIQLLENESDIEVRIRKM